MGVTCELCGVHTQTFNKHMRLKHPGCGGMVLAVLELQCLLKILDAKKNVL